MIAGQTGSKPGEVCGQGLLLAIDAEESIQGQGIVGRRDEKPPSGIVPEQPRA